MDLENVLDLLLTFPRQAGLRHFSLHIQSQAYVNAYKTAQCCRLYLQFDMVTVREIGISSPANEYTSNFCQLGGIS
jgi:hypothetical protein